MSVEIIDRKIVFDSAFSLATFIHDFNRIEGPTNRQDEPYTINLHLERYLSTKYG